jgi:hypothetical protein
MESYERDRAATDVEQDLGAPGESVESADTATPSLGSGAFGVGAPTSGERAATDVESDLGRPGDAYSSEPPATDPTLR